MEEGYFIIPAGIVYTSSTYCYEKYGVYLIPIEKWKYKNDQTIYGRIVDEHDPITREDWDWDLEMQYPYESFQLFCKNIRKQQITLYLCLLKETKIPKDVIKIIVKNVDDIAIYKGPLFRDVDSIIRYTIQHMKKSGEFEIIVTGLFIMLIMLIMSIINRLIYFYPPTFIPFPLVPRGQGIKVGDLGRGVKIEKVSSLSNFNAISLNGTFNFFTLSIICDINFSPLVNFLLSTLNCGKSLIRGK